MVLNNVILSTPIVCIVLVIINICNVTFVSVNGHILTPPYQSYLMSSVHKKFYVGSYVFVFTDVWVSPLSAGQLLACKEENIHRWSLKTNFLQGLIHIPFCVHP